MFRITKPLRRRRRCVFHHSTCVLSCSFSCFAVVFRSPLLLFALVLLLRFIFVLTNEIQLKFNLVHPSSRYSRTYLQLYTSDRIGLFSTYCTANARHRPFSSVFNCYHIHFLLVILSLYNMLYKLQYNFIDKYLLVLLTKITRTVCLAETVLQSVGETNKFNNRSQLIALLNGFFKRLSIYF